MRLRDVKQEITSVSVIYLKAVLILCVGLTSAIMLLAESRRLYTCSLLVICIWAFARAYYFAFYVIERYVDRTFRFSGLWSFAWYMWKRRAASRYERPAG